MVGMKEVTAPEAKTRQVARRDLAGGFHQADRQHMGVA
jgi:hypothetical protein